MAYENLCMYCFRDLNGGSICPHCGKDARAAVPQIQMLPGMTVYRDRFLVGRALGQDSGGIVYTAMDTKRGGTIRIREYLPRNCAERLNDGSVVPIAGMEDAFEAGMRKLRASVDSVEDPKKRHFYFEENGTAYIAQRKNGGGAPAADYSGADDEDEADHRRQIALYIAIAAAVVLAVAIGLIWFLNSMSDPEDVTLTNPLSTTSPGATWMPAETPTPTPYATATFAALVDPELSWMDYTYSGDVNSDYQQQVNASATRPAATRKPTVSTDEDYTTVSGKSSSERIGALQEHLVRLGWLNYTNITGKYDSATKQAVKDFQNYVNEYCSPAKKLTVDGIAGEKTQQWLYNASVSLVKPTATPTPLATPAAGSHVIDANSSAADIRDVQEKLIVLSLLPQGSADGRYGASTTTAVKNFQIRVNELQKYNALEITGIVNAETMAYLNYYVEWWLQLQQATATPAPTATLKPGQSAGTVNASSSRADVRNVQEMLISVGLLKSGAADGVYGSGTTTAVKNFQNWVNETRDELVLEVTGECDPLTKRYLEYCVENGRVVVQPTAKPTQPAVELPTATPEPTTEPEEDPNAGADSTIIDPSSPAESVSFMQEMLWEIGLMDASDVDGVYGAGTKNAIMALQQFVNDRQGSPVLEVTGICDADTLQYLIYCYDQGWNLADHGDQPDPEPTATQAPTQEPTAEPDSNGGITPASPKNDIADMQAMLAGVGLLDADSIDGSYGSGTASAVRRFQQRVNEIQGGTVLEVTGECDAATLELLSRCFNEGWNLGDQGDQPEPEPTQGPIEETTPEPTAEPAGTLTSFSVYVDGAEPGEGLIEVGAGKYDITWHAEGELGGYFVYLYDHSGNLIQSAENTDMTGFSLDTRGMVPGEVYTLEVSALPLNGTQEQFWTKTIQLILPVQVTPEPTATQAPTPEPTEQPSVSVPAINIGSSVYQSDGVTYINDDRVIFSWMASGPVDYYTITFYYEDGTAFPLGDTGETSKTVPTEQLQPGLYRVVVGATPVGGGETMWNELYFGIPAPQPVETPVPEPTEEPFVEPENSQITFIDASSTPEDIQIVQMALYQRGLLNADSVQPGVLDESTLQAVAVFQEMANADMNAGLYVIDPLSDAFIDAQTLALLLG